MINAIGILDIEKKSLLKEGGGIHPKFVIFPKLCYRKGREKSKKKVSVKS